MSISMYEASVGVFVPFLDNLSKLLDHASAYAETRRIDPQVLLKMRLAPTMYNLTQQVGEVTRHAVVASALPIGFIQGLPRATIDDAAEREVAFTFKNGTQRSFTGRSLLLTLSVPQFFFHLTTAYDILRHAGVDIVKKDFLGPPRQG